MTFSKGTFTMSDEEYATLVDDQIGLCTNCGAEKSNVEPDAENYQCDECEEKTVFGTEQLMLLNQIDLEDDEEEDDEEEDEDDSPVEEEDDDEDDDDEDFDEGEGD